VPTSDQSPVTQPVVPSKQLDDISSPQITTEEKIATPEQEEIKKELSELGIPPEGRGKKTKVILAALGVLLLAATLPVAVYLVKQRQEIRKQAYVGQICQTDADCDGQCEVCQNGKCETKTCGGDQCLGWGTCTCKSECSVSGDGYICCNGDWVSQGQGCADCEEPSPSPSPSPSPGQVTCAAGSWGVSATNNSNSQACGDYFKGKCRGDYSCFCGGAPTSFCLGPGESMNKGLDISGLCGSWQTDITIGDCHASDHGCEYCEEASPSPSPSPSPSSSPKPGCYNTCAINNDCQGDLVCQGSICVNADCPDESDCTCEAQCEYCKVFDEDWNEITDLSTIEVGQTVYLATFGSTSHAQGITKARFRINGGDWTETTERHQNMFYIQYVIPEAGSYLIESMVHNPGLGWY